MRAGPELSSMPSYHRSSIERSASSSSQNATLASPREVRPPVEIEERVKTEPLVGAEDLPKDYRIEKIENIETKEKDKKRILVTIGHIKRCTQ